MTGQQSVRFIRDFEDALRETLPNEVRGQVANKTVETLTGTICHIHVDYDAMQVMQKQMAVMQHGEILVAEFTTLELLLACRKAKAIITDIGGMLSHEAIISRELKIPCLVGTANITEQLHAGDTITIDFNSHHVTKTA